MSSYKEIVTKAVVGKGKKYFKNTYTIEATNKPSTVLGCWVINNNFKGYKTGEQIGVDGSFDVNIWYSYENDSKTTVINKNIKYNELFNVKVKQNADLTGDTDIIVRALKQPTCSKVNIEEDEEPWEDLDNEVTDEIEKEIDENVKEDFV